jgi:hypothetical protein
MNARPFLFPAFLALLAAGSAQAAGVGIRAGTTGVGADFGWSLAPTLSARVGYSALNWNRDISTDNVHYDGKVKLSNLSGLLDFSPAPGPFRITGGVIYDRNRYNVNGQPTGGTFTLNGNTYSASDVGSLSGQVKPGRDLAPYLGIGWGNVAGAGVNFYADLGVMFQGRPKSSLSATCGASLSASACAQLQSDTAAEQGRLDDKLRHFQYYPVLNVGVTIGF